MLETYRVLKSFSGTVIEPKHRYGRYWLNVDDIFQIMERSEDEDGKPIVSVRTPGLKYLLTFRASKLRMQAALIDSHVWEDLCRQDGRVMWEFGATDDGYVDYHSEC